MTLASLITNSTLTVTSSIDVHVAEAPDLFYLTPNLINPATVSSPSYSVWDMNLTNWSATSFGYWYFYCPDICAPSISNVEKSWIPFFVTTSGGNSYVPPSTIPFAWIKMNAIRFQSQGSAGSESTAIKASYGSFSKSIAINYGIDSSYTTPIFTGLNPYTGFAQICDSDSMTLGPEKGISGLTFPWGSYSLMSPMRPLCVSVGGAPGVTYFAGDFQITPSTDQNVTASAKFTLSSDLSLPIGFSLMQFSGSFSNMGDVRNVVSFQAVGNFTIVTPQINLDYLSSINYASDALGAIAYDKSNGNMWYIPSSGTYDSLDMPKRYKMQLPGTCVLIFGSLLQNTVLPATIGTQIKYLGSWGKKIYSFAPQSSTSDLSLKLNITITGDQDSNFVVYENPASVLSYENINPIVYYDVGFTASPIVKLSYPNSSSYIWAAYKEANTASGKQWVALDTTVDEVGAIHTNITDIGVYAVVSKQSISSANRIVQGYWAFALPLLMSILFL